MDRKWYESHLKVNILGSGAVQQCCVEEEERRSAGTWLKPRDQAEREVHLRELLLRYWDKQQAWVKKAEPYTFRTKNIRSSYFLLQFDTVEMADLWRKDAENSGMYLWKMGGGYLEVTVVENNEGFYLPLMTWSNIDTLMSYIRKVW